MPSNYYLSYAGNHIVELRTIKEGDYSESERYIIYYDGKQWVHAYSLTRYEVARPGFAKLIYNAH